MESLSDPTRSSSREVWRVADVQMSTEALENEKGADGICLLQWPKCPAESGDVAVTVIRSV